MDKEFLMGLEGVTEAVAEAILAEHGKAVAGFESQLKAQATQSAVALAIATAGGRNQKAIAALLDMDALQSAEDVAAAAAQAVAQVKKENTYLFASAPAYAPGTGASGGFETEEPQSLAEALREKFAGDRKVN